MVLSPAFKASEWANPSIPKAKPETITGPYTFKASSRACQLSRPWAWISGAYYCYKTVMLPLKGASLEEQQWRIRAI